MKQWRKDFHGWQIIVTRGQGGGIGIAWHYPVRWNGIGLLLGPIIIDISPPMPEFTANPNSQ